MSRKMAMVRLLGLALLTLAAGRAARAADPGGEPVSFRPPVDRAVIGLHVPPGAEVWVAGQKSSQAGTTRVFLTPPLAPGRSYTYHVRVRWSQDGQVTEHSRPLTVRAGVEVGLDCSPQRAAATPPAPPIPARHNRILPASSCLQSQTTWCQPVPPAPVPPVPVTPVPVAPAPMTSASLPPAPVASTPVTSVPVPPAPRKSAAPVVPSDPVPEWFQEIVKLPYDPEMIKLLGGTPAAEKKEASGGSAPAREPAAKK